MTHGSRHRRQVRLRNDSIAAVMTPVAAILSKYSVTAIIQWAEGENRTISELAAAIELLGLTREARKRAPLVREFKRYLNLYPERLLALRESRKSRLCRTERLLWRGGHLNPCTPRDMRLIELSLLHARGSALPIAS